MMEAPTKFVTEPSRSLKCPCCDGMFIEPVISIGCGHTFCKECISGTNDPVAGEEPVCPLDQTKLDSSSFVANRAVQGQLEELQIYCRHALTRYDSEEDFLMDENGCQEIIVLGHREEHESVCQYALLPCPNSSNFCGKFRRKDLEDHLKICDRVPCQNADQGCSFFGTRDEVEEHQTRCKRSGSPNSGSDHSVHLEVDGNGLSARHMLKKMKTLTEKVADLEKDKEQMSTQLKQANSQISRLKTHLDNLTKLVEQLRLNQLAVARSRIGSQSTSDMVALPDAYSYRSSSNSVSSPTTSAPALPWNSSSKQESWKMPFTFKCIGTFRGHSGAIWALTTRGKLLFSAGGDFTIKVWDISDIKNSKGCMQTLIGHRGDIHALCTGDGCLYSAGSDKSIRVWNLRDYQLQIVKEDAHDNIICAILYTRKFIFTSSFASIKVWKAGTLELVHSISDLKHWVRALAFDKKKDKIYSGSHNTVYMWDANTFALRGKLDHNHGSVYSLAVTERFLIVGTYNRNTHLHDINTFQEIKDLNGHLGTITGITPSPSGTFLFTCSSDNTVQVWDIEKMLPIQVLSRHEGSVNCVVLRGDLLYSGSADREIKVYAYYKLCENAFIR